MPDGGERSRMLGLWDEILTAWAAAGRPGRPRWVAGGYFALGPGAEEAARAAMHANYAFNPELADRLARATPASRDAVIEAIETKAEMGVDEYILRPVAPDMAARSSRRDRVVRRRDEVAPGRCLLDRLVEVAGGYPPAGIADTFVFACGRTGRPTPATDRPAAGPEPLVDDGAAVRRRSIRQVHAVVVVGERRSRERLPVLPPPADERSVNGRIRSSVIISATSRIAFVIARRSSGCSSRLGSMR
jgi:hypothetical protein